MKLTWRSWLDVGGRRFAPDRWRIFLGKSNTNCAPRNKQKNCLFLNRKKNFILKNFFDQSQEIFQDEGVSVDKVFALS